MTKGERLAQIKARVEKLDADRAIIEKNWADDVKKTVEDPKFDAYSKKGEKILRKIADKYTPMFIEVDDERDALVAEHNAIIDSLTEKKKDSKKND